MERIKNIIFDFDGTLADTAPLIVATMQATISELSLPERDEAQCRATIGLRLEDVPDALWPDCPFSGETFARTYRRIFDILKCQWTIKCYPGVIDTLRELAACGFRLAVASSRNRSSLAEYTESFGIADLFVTVVGGNDVSRGKPAPDPVLLICEKENWLVDETLVVGDAVFDIEMGKNAEATTCAVTYGNQSRAELAATRPDAIIDSFPAILAIACGVNPALVDYVEHKILPGYAAFDKAHREDHVRMVIGQSLKIARHLGDTDIDMVYAIAAFHDLGLCNGRENHHNDSGRIILADPFLAGHFSPAQLQIMAQAAEDHRASNKHAPRSIYGNIVADADRFIDAETIIRRTIQYGLANYPQLDQDGQYERALNHIKAKYAPGGYMKLQFPWSDNAIRLEQLHEIIADTMRLKQIFDRIYAEETT